MGKIWNPRAKRETVGEFLAAWCIRNAGSWSGSDALFGAYEIYCRAYGEHDLTLGEFNTELEQLGFRLEHRHGSQMWSGIGLAYMQDVTVRRGPKPRGER